MAGIEVIEQWTVRLAEVAVPDEVDLAPAIADAYIQGGPAREALYAPSDDISGAFGPIDMVLIMPRVLKGIYTAGRWILPLLASKELGNVLSAVKDAIALKSATQKRTSPTLPPSTPAKTLPTTPPYDALKKTIDIINHELKGAGLSNDHADLITFRIIDALLADPQGGTEFINYLYGDDV